MSFESSEPRSVRSADEPPLPSSPGPAATCHPHQPELAAYDDQAVPAVCRAVAAMPTRSTRTIATMIPVSAVRGASANRVKCNGSAARVDDATGVLTVPARRIRAPKSLETCAGRCRRHPRRTASILTKPSPRWDHLCGVAPGSTASSTVHSAIAAHHEHWSRLWVSFIRSRRHVSAESVCMVSSAARPAWLTEFDSGTAIGALIRCRSRRLGELGLAPTSATLLDPQPVDPQYPMVERDPGRRISRGCITPCS